MKKYEAKAMPVLGISHSDEHFEHVRGTKSAFSKWKEVMSLFQGRALLNCLTDPDWLYSATMADGEHLLAYPMRIGHLAGALKAMDATITEQKLCMTVLCGLQYWIEHLTVAIDTIAEDEKLSL